MERAGGSPWLWLRVALVGFVLAWIRGPIELRNVVPVLVVFVVALGLEVHRRSVPGLVRVRGLLPPTTTTTTRSSAPTSRRSSPSA